LARIPSSSLNVEPPPSTVARVIAARKLRVAFQPIVDMKRGNVFAFEALARCDSSDFRSPIELFRAAVEENMVGRLGREVRRLATEGCMGRTLFLNVHPAEFAEPWLVRPDDPIFCHDAPVFLEITESVPLSHYGQCNSILREIRSKGVSLVVDDLGAGYSNLKYISDLAPEVFKLDRGLIAGLNSDTRLMTLVRCIVQLCTDLGAHVVAEGVETEAELGAIRDAGVRYAQGFYFGRPSYPPAEFEREELESLIKGKKRVQNGPIMGKNPMKETGSVRRKRRTQ
jgi:EAL domain-containing protein (putative c-di-GMP-specific phosphodiesterase class I)